MKRVTFSEEIAVFTYEPVSVEHLADWIMLSVNRERFARKIRINYEEILNEVIKSKLAQILLYKELKQ